MSRRGGRPCDAVDCNARPQSLTEGYYTRIDPRRLATGVLVQCVRNHKRLDEGDGRLMRYHLVPSGYLPTPNTGMGFRRLIHHKRRVRIPGLVLKANVVRNAPMFVCFEHRVYTCPTDTGYNQ